MMKKLLLALLFLLVATPASAQLAISNFSATGTVHMLVRVTVTIDTRGNGQENLWASSAWEESGTPDPTGSIDEGSWDITGITGNAPVIRRFARWDNTGDDNRLIFNTTGTDNISELFDLAADPYRLSIVRDISGTPTVMTWVPPSTSGGTGFIDWREGEGGMTTAMWTFLDGIATGGSVIVALHQGVASYSEAETKEYVGGIEIIKEYVGDVEITGEYVGDIEIF